MPIDPSILLGVKGVNIKQPDEIGDVGKILTLKHLLQQGELGGVQLDNARRDAAENERFRALFAGGTAPTPAQAMAAAPKLAQPYIKSLNDQQLHTATMDKTKAQTEQIRAEGLASVFGQAKDQESYDIGRRVALERGWMTPQQMAQLPEQFDPKLTQYLALGSMKAADRIAAERNAETQRHNQTVEGREGRNALIGPNGPNEAAIAARERVARAGDPTRIAIANAGLQARTNETNSFLGPNDQVQAPQVGAPSGLPAAMPGGAGTSWNGQPLRRESDLRAAVGTIPQAPAVQPGEDAAQVLFRNQPGMRQDGAPPGTTGAYLPPEGAVFKPADATNTAPINSPASAAPGTGGRELSARARAAAGADRPRLKQGERYTADGNIEAIPGSDVYVRQSDKHGKDYAALNAVNTKTSNAVAKIDEILSEKYKPAFNNNFGGYNAYATRLFPGQTQDIGREIDSLKSDLKSAGLELIRAGGAIGQMTEREWPIVERMIANIDPRLGVEKAREEFGKIKDYLKEIQGNAKNAYDVEWGETQYAKRGQQRRSTDAPPASTRFDSLPDPAKFAGRVATGDDGIKYKSDGKRWVRQ